MFLLPYSICPEFQNNILFVFLKCIKGKKSNGTHATQSRFFHHMKQNYTSYSSKTHQNDVFFYVSTGKQ